MSLSVAIDAFRLVSEPFTSGAIYVSELAQGLSVLPEINKVYLIFPRKPPNDFVYTNLLSQTKIQFFWPTFRFFPEWNFCSELVWIQCIIPYLLNLKRERIDYYIAPYHNPPLLLSKKIKVVTVVHDLCGMRADCGYIKTKKGFYQHLIRFIISAIRSDRVVPISEYTKKELEKFLPFLSSRISQVVYNGVNCESLSKADAEKLIRHFPFGDKSFFLGFGALGLRKGFDLILRAYKLYRLRGGDAVLVLIVQENDVNTIKRMLQDQGLTDVFIVSNIDPVKRDSLYRYAKALLFPSRCEGFGLPIIEAMRQGCPPIAYQDGPASEIIDGILPLLKKLDTEEIVNLMEIFDSADTATRMEMDKHLVKRSFSFTSEMFGKNFCRAMKEE